MKDTGDEVERAGFATAVIAGLETAAERAARMTADALSGNVDLIALVLIKSRRSRLRAGARGRKASSSLLI